MTTESQQVADRRDCAPSSRHKVGFRVLFLCAFFLLLLLWGGDQSWGTMSRLPTAGSQQEQLEHRGDADSALQTLLALSWRQLVRTRGENRTRSSRIIVYNRVDKCGSTTLLSLIRRLAKKTNKFKSSTSTTYFQRFLSASDQLKVVRSLTKQSRKLPLVFDRHVYFTDFTKFNESQPIYINLIRDPVERFISLFYFLRLDMRYKKMQRNRPGSDWLNKTLTECVLGDDPECSMTNEYHHRGPRGDEVFHQMTSFFCGHEPVCREFNNRTALQKALQNLEKKYAVVGILESFHRSLEVLEAYVPMYFRDVVKLYTKKPQEMNTNPSRPEAPPSVKQTLATRLSADMELYKFAEQRLYLQYRRIGGSITSKGGPTSRSGSHERPSQ